MSDRAAQPLVAEREREKEREEERERKRDRDSQHNVLHGFIYPRALIGSPHTSKTGALLQHPQTTFCVFVSLPAADWFGGSQFLAILLAICV